MKRANIKELINLRRASRDCEDFPGLDSTSATERSLRPEPLQVTSAAALGIRSRRGLQHLRVQTCSETSPAGGALLSDPLVEPWAPKCMSKPWNDVTSDDTSKAAKCSAAKIPSPRLVELRGSVEKGIAVLPEFLGRGSRLRTAVRSPSCGCLPPLKDAPRLQSMSMPGHVAKDARMGILECSALRMMATRPALPSDSDGLGKCFKAKQAHGGTWQKAATSAVALSFEVGSFMGAPVPFSFSPELAKTFTHPTWLDTPLRFAAAADPERVRPGRSLSMPTISRAFKFS